jgi:hypothetical protein
MKWMMRKKKSVKLVKNLSTALRAALCPHPALLPARHNTCAETSTWEKGVELYVIPVTTGIQRTQYVYPQP